MLFCVITIKNYSQKWLKTARFLCLDYLFCPLFSKWMQSYDYFPIAQSFV